MTLDYTVQKEGFTHFDCSYNFQLCTFSPKYQLLRQQTEWKKKKNIYIYIYIERERERIVKEKVLNHRTECC